MRHGESAKCKVQSAKCKVQRISNEQLEISNSGCAERISCCNRSLRSLALRAAYKNSSPKATQVKPSFERRCPVGAENRMRRRRITSRKSKASIQHEKLIFVLYLSAEIVALRATLSSGASRHRRPSTGRSPQRKAKTGIVAEGAYKKFVAEGDT